jgi:hypothetical protein
MRRRPSPAAQGEILRLVQTGVENFILKKSTMADFMETLRDVSNRSGPHANQLTSAVFKRIVKKAIEKRNARRSRRH